MILDFLYPRSRWGFHSDFVLVINKCELLMFFKGKLIGYQRKGEGAYTMHTISMFEKIQS